MVELNPEFKSEEATMELSDRRLVHFAMAAWLEPNSWQNLKEVRDKSTGTMSITQTTVENICKLIIGAGTAYLEEMDPETRQPNQDSAQMHFN